MRWYKSNEFFICLIKIFWSFRNILWPAILDIFLSIYEIIFPCKYFFKILMVWSSIIRWPNDLRFHKKKEHLFSKLSRVLEVWVHNPWKSRPFDKKYSIEVIHRIIRYATKLMSCISELITKYLKWFHEIVSDAKFRITKHFFWLIFTCMIIIDSNFHDYLWL